MKYLVIVTYKNGDKSKMVQESHVESDIPFGSYLSPFNEIPEIKEKLNKYFHFHQIKHGEIVSADVVLEKSKEDKNFKKNQIQTGNN